GRRRARRSACESWSDLSRQGASIMPGCGGWSRGQRFRTRCAFDKLLRLVSSPFLGASMRASVFVGMSILSVLAGTVAAQTGRPGGRGGPTTTIHQGESCPEGTTEIRPRSCMAPTLPAPSIVDYRPRSTLVTPAHL